MSANQMKFNLQGGGSVDVEVSQCLGGNGVTVSQRFTATDGTESTTVTCTCWDSAGHSYSTTKQCPDGNNTCDCSTPSSPKITCG